MSKPKDKLAVCPHCGGDDTLEFNESQFFDETPLLGWKCDQCGAEGVAYFTAKFSHHEYNAPPAAEEKQGG